VRREIVNNKKRRKRNDMKAFRQVSGDSDVWFAVNPEAGDLPWIS
jgi:hypothetical protein